MAKSAESSEKLGGFIVTADWHAHCWRDGGEPVGGINSRLMDFLNALRELIGYAREWGVKRIYVLGDVFHLKKGIPEQARNQVWSYLYPARDLEWVFLAGNHDREDDRYDSVTILPFRAIGRVVIEPEVDEDIVYVPWLYDQGRVLKFLTQQKRERKLLLFHGELDGAEVGPTDYMLKSTFTDKALGVQRYQQVFAGHLHRKQMTHNVRYPGSLIAKDFGELERDKGFYHVLPTGKMREVMVTYPKFVVTHATQKDFKNDVDWAAVEKELKGNFVRLLVTQSLDESIVKRLEQCHPRLLEIKLERADMAVKSRLLSAGERTFEDLVRGYVEHKGVPPELVDEYVAYGRQKLED